MKQKKSRKKLSIDKYNFGSFVTKNQQGIAGAGNALAGVVSGVAGDSVGGSAVSGAISGAATGSLLGPPGMLVGGILGGLGGLLGGRKRKQEQERVERERLVADKTNYANNFTANLDTANENPYGVYQLGGEVALPTINIEEGELQIDPMTGKILREYTGINPETGGKYKPHSKGKDTKNNLVTAEEGSFIVTKEKSKEYKDAIDNNDKLHQNAILQNIRNKKRSQDRKDVQAKYQTGGDIRLPSINLEQSPYLYSREELGLPGFSPSLSPTQSSRSIVPTFNPNTGTTVNSGINTSGVLNTIVDLAPAAMNIAQSFRTPDYLPRASTAVNPYRSEVLENMPTEVNMTPLVNRLYRDRNSAFSRIGETTSSSAVARANMANVEANTDRAVQDAYFQGELTNNQIRGQRASLYNQLGEADRASEVNNRNYNLGIDTSNRQMDLANRQYRNLGLSQLQEVYRNKQNMKQLQNNDSIQLEALRRLFPALGSYLPEILRGGNYGG